MGDSAKKKTIQFDSVPQTSRFDSIRFYSIHCSVHTGGSGLWSEAAGPVHWSHDRPARIATELLIAFAEVTSDIAANASHDAILQHNDAHS